MRLPSVLHRLTALVSAVLMILASLGLAPTVSADTSDDSLSFEIHENKTVDITMTQKGDDAGSKSNCNPDDIEDSFDDDDVKVSVKSGDGGDSCTVTVKGLTLKKFNNNTPAEITHEDGSFTFRMDIPYLEQGTVKVTFPGKVSKVSGNGKKSGNTATWKNAQDETRTLIAKGADHGSPLFTILIVIVVIATIGGVVIFIIIRQKRAKTGIAPGHPQPGQQPYNPQQPYNSQPGYGQPGQAPAVPGTAQPGYYTQPGAQQSYSPQSDYDQPGQQPRSPGGQH